MATKKKSLTWCQKCCEYSMASKVYTRKDTQRVAVSFCINRGCGNKDSHMVGMSGTDIACDLGDCPYVNVDCGQGYCVRQDEAWRD